MYGAIATVVGASIIAGSIVWASDQHAKSVRCAGYLASANGSDSVLRIFGGGKNDRTSQAAFHALKLAGCPFERPFNFPD